MKSAKQKPRLGTPPNAGPRLPLGCATKQQQLIARKRGPRVLGRANFDMHRSRGRHARQNVALTGHNAKLIGDRAREKIR